MIVAILQHFVKPGMVEVAEGSIDANGDRMAKVAGFLFRHVLVAFKDPHKIVTLTAWESLEHYEDWLRQQRGASPVGVDLVEDSPYVRLDTELFTVRSSGTIPST